MAGFPGSGLKSIVAQREKSVWAGGVGGGHATDGETHAGLLFRTRKIWMSRDLWDFLFRFW